MMDVREQTIFSHKGKVIQTSDRRVDIIARIEEPLVVILGNVLSDEECDELIRMSKDRLERSKIGTVHEVNEDIRTSKGMFFQEAENTSIQRIEHRIAEIMDVPIEYGEPLQVLRYQVGQEYKPHFDFFTNPSVKNNRISTLVIYLNDVGEGGETIFPSLNLSVSAKRGCAVYFEYFYNDSALNEQTLHAGTPVVNGEKWVATQWMRKQKYRS